MGAGFARGQWPCANDCFANCGGVALEITFRLGDYSLVALFP
nr:hypothetical protein [Kibdelosporangium sp. MJ126-NF4]CTQ97749.1 hypothetical protein [Kibdelosporangium sp. MJ126-NF4]